MKAAVLTSSAPISNQPLKLLDMPQPALTPGHVLLRVRACGVCRTELHIIEGELPSRRAELVPGHQIVGEIVEGTDALPPGTRVGVSWIGGVDGTCWYCQHKMENLCDSPVFTGYTVDGGYAEYALARSDDVVLAALASLRKGGVVAINAIHLDRVPEFDYDTLLWGEREMRSVANMTRADASEFLNLAAEIKLHPQVTVFSLDKVNEA